MRRYCWEQIDPLFDDEVTQQELANALNDVVSVGRWCRLNTSG